MKILYAIQGTGNGHLSRARDVVPALKKFCEVDILVSGYQADVKLPFEVKYNYRGLSFIFGKKGGVDMWNTYVKANIKKLREEIKSVPVEDYDFVINDFEPVSAWACYKKKVPCVAFSHQSAVLNPNAPKPKTTDLMGRFILKNYAPSNMQFGLHFSRYSPTIFTPIIRSEIRQAKLSNKGHYTVYLPAYGDDKLVTLLSEVKGTKWHIFSKHTKKSSEHGDIKVFPITNELYIESLRKSAGLLCGAGFEGPAEALHMGKKLMVVPMKGQYEQQCNAAALKSMGVPVIKKLNESKIGKIQNWVDSDYRVEVDYPDVTELIIKQIFESHVLELIKKNNWNTTFSLKFDKKDLTGKESSKNKKKKNKP
ncbi:MAG: glycosyl transferase [Bacteroidota bacterium]|nr:MAG: glycosyl transferase [Bacteroidota bacterium]